MEVKEKNCISAFKVGEMKVIAVLVGQGKVRCFLSNLERHLSTPHSGCVLSYRCVPKNVCCESVNG